MMKQYPHTPNHLFLNDTPYFITAAIYQKRRLMAAETLKTMLRDILKEMFAKYAWQLHHWVILDNHYHLLGQSRKGKDLSKLIRDIHFESALRIQEATGCDKPIWWNYWDYCPRNEREYMIRQTYLLYNPVKHGYVSDLRNYVTSSFHEAFKELGRDGLAEQFRTYSEYKTLRITEALDDDF